MILIRISYHMARSLLPCLFALAACSVHQTPTSLHPQPAETTAVGVLVMAHGGGAVWNRSVADAVAPLRDVLPTAVAYGMANPITLSAGLDSLRAAGVHRVAVVRLFLSGESFLEQTEYFLGLSSTPPGAFVLMDPEQPRLPLEHGMRIATHSQGLVGSAQARAILVERSRDLSLNPSTESVLLVAHGMGDEGQNEKVLEAMDAIAQTIKLDGFAAVDISTLREDWADKRTIATERIRRLVAHEVSKGRRVLVLPVRLSGFGPYAEVLEGLEYSPGTGLLPHPMVVEWIRSTATRVVCEAGWGPAVGVCPP